MPRILTRGRWVGLLLIGAGSYFATDFLTAKSQVEAVIATRQRVRPLEMKVDLSKPGSVTAPFHQTLEVLHGEGIFLEIDSSPVTGNEQQDLLRGLVAELVIHDLSGGEVCREPLVAGTSGGCGFATGQLLAVLPQFPEGEHTATLQVKSAVPVLAGRSQSLYARYHLCGMVLLNAKILGALGYGSLALAVVASVCVLPGLWKDVRLGVPATKPPQPPDINLGLNPTPDH